MQRPTKKVAFAVQRSALCNAAMGVLQCSVTKRGPEEAGAKYHRTGSGTIKSRTPSFSGMDVREAPGEQCRAEPLGKVLKHEMFV